MTIGDLLRADLRLIADRVPQGARVLDLGCGDGALLEAVRTSKGAFVRGIELSQDGVAGCVRRSIPVIQTDLDDGLAGFPRASFDVVILSQTLQVVRRPRLVLQEMLRVGKTGIVSFPNFAHWRLRSHLAIKGKMPMSTSIPYSWYDTPNIHHTTIKDFRDLCSEMDVRIVGEYALTRPEGHEIRRVRTLPNLFAEVAIVEVTRD